MPDSSWRRSSGIKDAIRCLFHARRARSRWPGLLPAGSGRDAYGGEVARYEGIADLSAAEIAFHTASARRYGFHATLKAPFKLARDQDEASLIAAFDAFCAAHPAVVVATYPAGPDGRLFSRSCRRSGCPNWTPWRPNRQGFEPFFEPRVGGELARAQP